MCGESRTMQAAAARFRLATRQPVPLPRFRARRQALRARMSHRSHSTTQRYIDIARQLDRSAADLYFTDLEPKKAAI